jgi:hypothetical protein
MESWSELLGDVGIRTRVAQNPLLAEVLGEALQGIQGFLEGIGLPYRLDARLTRSGEYLIRMQVGYRDWAERDRIWDQAAQILERARAGRDVHILCGISRLPQMD